MTQTSVCKCSRPKLPGARVSTRGTLAVALVAVALTTGCAENGEMFRGMSWFQKPALAGAEKTYVTLPDGVTGLGSEGLEGSLRNAMDLAKAKRFDEARAALNDLSGSLAPGSEIWRAVKCSELTLAIRGGDLAALVTSADAVERTLRDALRPPNECVQQLAIARAIRGRPLPINTPEGLAAALQASPAAQGSKVASRDSASVQTR
ncbi:MAG: hypothetical protein FJ271_31455 [Planctomycetes bacterium]|nr:hypothetical protein [Planctomycetota bacterium]